MASLLEMSLGGCCIILTAALLRWAAKDRLPVGMFEAMWALACLRLTVPARLPFRLSAFALLRRAVPHTAGTAPVPAAAAQPGQAASHIVDIIQDIPQADLGRPFPAVTVLWLAGTALCAGAFLVSYIRACRRFRGAESVNNDYVNQFWAEHPLRRQASVRVSERVAAPLTYGVLRPVILLPRSMDLADSGTLGYVLAHELAHIRRFDALRKPALAAVACLHWFDPAVWLMAVLAGRDMERSCDRAVVRAFGSEARRDYAMALLTMEERRGGFSPSSGFAKNAIEERIHSIMKIRPRSFLSTLLALALVLSAGAAFATAAPEDEAVISGADGPTITVSDDMPAALSGDVMTSSDGTVYVFTADGEPVSLTQQEYKLLFEPVEVQWWTAEEYAAWLEQEKKDLQDCLGQRAWTSADGWFTWTQEKIDETIGMYEQVLEEIENGLLVSKTVDGRSDVALMQGGGDVLYDGSGDGIVMYKYDEADDGWTTYMMTEDEAAAGERQQLEQQLARLDQERAEIEQKLASMEKPAAETEQQASLTDRLTQWEDALAPYAPFGVTYKYNEQTDDVELYWDGDRVRGLYDGTAGVWITGHSGDGTWPEGTAELVAVYTDGELTGLRLATEKEQAQWDRLRESAGVSGSPDPAAQPVQEADGTVAVPPNENVTVFFGQADGAPYGSVESGGRIRAGQVTAARGNTVAVSLTTRTDASLTVSLHGDAADMGKGVDLKAGQTQTVTFSPEQADTFVIYLTNNSDYPVEFIASWAVS